MQFAQKLHSIEEMEENRIKFYQRFKELDQDPPHLTYNPIYELEGESENSKENT